MKDYTKDEFINLLHELRLTNPDNDSILIKVVDYIETASKHDSDLFIDDMNAYLGLTDKHCPAAFVVLDGFRRQIRRARLTFVEYKEFVWMLDYVGRKERRNARAIEI